MVAIVNYGLGNINAFLSIYNELEIEAKAVSSPAELRKASKIILPGVGSFDWAMTLLNQSGMRETLDDLVLNKNVPVLGICVGMQIMAKFSDEGKLAGLGWIDSKVTKFNFDNSKILPHMGWNRVNFNKNSPLLKNLTNPEFYFLHSYYFKKNNNNFELGITNYYKNFCSVINSNNIYGTQFHPEKSHLNGITLLKNFNSL